MALAVRFVLIAVVGLLLAAGPALALGGGGSKTPTGDPNYAKAEKLVEKGEYADAIPLLNKVVDADPANADAFNYLGYSHRKLGNFDDALKNYQTALKIKPKHKGANEYLGELYLQMGQLGKAEERLAVLDKAEERLAVLDKACFFKCSAYKDLKKAIAEYKAAQGS